MSILWFVLLIAFIIYMIFFDRKLKKTESYQAAKSKGEKPTRKLLSKRWWSWGLIAFLVVAWFTAISIEADQHDKDYKARSHQTTKKSKSPTKKPTAKKPKKQMAKVKATPKAAPKKSKPISKSKTASVPREYKNALLTLMDYQNTDGDMSYKGLYDQLTSDAGEGFTPAAANYALSHAKIDYNKNALKCAKNYEETEHMSTSELQEQLTSDAGEKFTPEQAQYAIQHLDK
ncbi:Ltp family lipoprotein [uncultured Lactobacillus sp.]|uniref:Ltp family lipoprotein n=1 Tax=uncultured Lactobacillus sp. TaxID=153152 RepID=UPI0025EBBACE|nr:Ltp family lipoprotein [uncultured Lactobacillus sp.]